MMSRTLFAALSLCALSSLAQAAKPICMLCEEGVDGIIWQFHNTDSQGTTCLQRAINMAGIQPNTLECKYNIDQYRDMCCGLERPDPIEQAPVLLRPYNGPTGGYSTCNICRDGDYPGNTAMVINMLYLWTGSCAQYYDYGRAGLVPDHLCDPLQFFAYEPCGCGRFNKRLHSPAPTIHPGPPKKIAISEPITTPPSSCPSSAPSKRPSIQPSQSPSKAPSQRPSNAPSSAPQPLPSRAPSSPPSMSPSKAPSSPPSSLPSSAPSHLPSSKPSQTPSMIPSVSPSDFPSSLPSDLPSEVPSMAPSKTPSDKPSTVPSKQPSSAPSSLPSTAPTQQLEPPLVLVVSSSEESTPQTLPPTTTTTRPSTTPAPFTLAPSLRPSTQMTRMTLTLVPTRPTTKKQMNTVKNHDDGRGTTAGMMTSLRGPNGRGMI